MARAQVRMRRTAVAMNALAAAAILEFSVVLHSGKGGNWALPTFLLTIASLATFGLVLGIRAQRTEEPDPGT